MAKLIVEDLKKTYFSSNGNGGNVIALQKITFEIKEGEFVTVFGPNGCGKTTLIKVLAGIESYESGEVLIDNKPPKLSRTGVVFQDYGNSLMPWLRCKDNILFPYRLNRRKSLRKDAEERLGEILSFLNINLPLENFPYELSGGQQQLIALLRTLLYAPDVILLDEPFSALDINMRSLMQQAIINIWEKVKSTILFVSHDIEEAIFLADRILLLTPLPAEVKDIKIVPFSRPRTIELFESREFFDFKLECLHVIRNST